MRTLPWLLMLSTFAATAHAQDAAGCTDHPILPSRVPGYTLGSCEKTDFATHDFPIEGKDPLPVEGKKTVLRYELAPGAKASSDVFIGRNYANALVKLGGKQLFARPWTVQLKRGAQEVWVSISGYIGEGSPEEMGQYLVVIVEKGQMEQVVSAADIFSELKARGRVALYVQFDTGKATIKPASEPLLAQMAKLLADNKALSVYVVGHTDTQGALEKNLTLSTERADAVTKALTKLGIAASRLTAKGVGPLSPLASNDTEEGRQQNRRVELVKQ